MASTIKHTDVCAKKKKKTYGGIPVLKRVSCRRHRRRRE